MITLMRRLVTGPVLALTALLAVLMVAPSAATAAPRDNDHNVSSSRTTMKRVNKPRTNYTKRLKPYKYQHAVRYPSASTQRPTSAPCSVIGTDSARWPAGIASCY